MGSPGWDAVSIRWDDIHPAAHIAYPDWMSVGRGVQLVGAFALAVTSACAFLPGNLDNSPNDIPAGRRWIWVDGDEVDGSEGWFWKAFEYDGVVERAMLFATCDNRMELFLNGDSVVWSDRWADPILLDVTDAVRSGRNVLGVHGTNGEGPAGLVLELTITGDGGTLRVDSNTTWRVTTDQPGGDWMTVDSSVGGRAWRAAVDLGGYGAEPWGDLGEGAPPPPNEALAASELELPDGFEAELLVSVPRARHGSWVSLCADDRGRLYASDQYGGLFRITPAPPSTPPATGASGSTLVEEVDVELGEAHGLLWAFDSLYVVVNAGGTYESGLYRVRDTNADDALDDVQLLKSFDGDGEHGPHAVLLSPEGDALFVIAGNHTALPSDLTSSRVPELWDEDQLLPRLPDPSGHAVGKLAPGGWICKTDRDGKEWELFAIGFRNAYDIDFDSAGELFTFDADMEYDTGLPWYRPTRILHVTSGAEFGWRNGTGKWPAFYPDSLGTTVDLGPTSPTGVVFGTRARFPAPWRNALFAADWAYGTIYAVHLEPDGAGYTGNFETFITGRPMPVTDLAIGTDGALYFTTGGRRTQSGLYRVTWTGNVDPVRHEQPVEAAAVDDDVLRRRALEALHGTAPPDASAAAAIRDVWPGLDDADRSIRFAARTALEHQDPALWRDLALAEESLSASIQALVGLIRRDETLTATELVGRLERWPWEAMDDATLQRALRVVALGLIRVPSEQDPSGDDDITWAPLTARLIDLLPTGSDLTDRELCRVLTRVQCDTLAPKAIELLEAAPSPEAAIDLALILSNLRTGWTDELRARSLRWFDVDSGELEGGASFEDYLAEIREDALESLGVSLPSAPTASVGTPIEARTAPQAPFVKNWTLDDLTSELERTSAGRSFERGRELFIRTSCLDCHRIDGTGGVSGPDLTGTGARFGPRDLLESLLEPSAALSDQYIDTEVWTLDGKVVVGRLVEVEDDHVVLKRTGDDVRITIESGDIDLQRPHPLSRMPEGLLDTCTLDEILDLLAYVLAGGDATGSAFSK